VVRFGPNGIYPAIDFVGNVMNVAAKIQAKAGPNQYFIGEGLFRLVHASYKSQCITVAELELQKYKYAYYRLDMKLT